MHLLIREVGLVVVGATLASVVQVYSPLTETTKRLFTGLIVLATGIAMAHVGGFLP